MPGSRGSGTGSIAGSTRSGFKAPTNPKPSFVDESLFGSKTQDTGPGLATAQVEALKKSAASAKKTKAPQDVPDVVTMSKADLERMVKASPVMSASDVAAMKKTLQARREEAQAVSKARKEKMLKLEEEARKKAPETETERLKAAVNKKLQTHAEHLLEEEKDSVKHMNQMMLYSKCVTIRDAQIQEKKQLMLETEDEKRRQDLMMEIERIKALEQYEARELQRNEERRRGAKVLEDQIAQREFERLRQEELRDQERIQMLREAERLKEDELQQAIERKIQAQALLSEVAAANAEQIKRKELLKIREKEEDMKILEYIRAKDAREQEIAFEKERVRHEKEMETVRLRTMQERAADKQAELDELRARRYQETKDREWRAKEKAAAERHATMQKDLEDAREAQKAAKMLQRAEMAKVEHDEFMRVLAVNHARELEDLQMQAAALTINDKYKEELQAQIASNEEQKKKERQMYLEEGRRIREAAEVEKARLAAIKARKLKDLEDAGVPAKYRAELEKYKLQIR